MTGRRGGSTGRHQGPLHPSLAWDLGHSLPGPPSSKGKLTLTAEVRWAQRRGPEQERHGSGPWGRPGTPVSWAGTGLPRPRRTWCRHRAVLRARLCDEQGQGPQRGLPAIEPAGTGAAGPGPAPAPRPRHSQGPGQGQRTHVSGTVGGPPEAGGSDSTEQGKMIPIPDCLPGSCEQPPRFLRPRPEPGRQSSVHSACLSLPGRQPDPTCPYFRNWRIPARDTRPNPPLHPSPHTSELGWRRAVRSPGG